MKKILTALIGVLALNNAGAQNYQALHGSPYSGSLSNDYNPAGILNSPYKWDLTLFGMQGKFITNAFHVTNASLFHFPDTIIVHTKTGTFARNFLASADLHLLNARYSFNRRSAIAIGLNLRNYMRVIGGPYSYDDTTIYTHDFMAINTANLPLGANGAQASWLEGFVTYSRVIYEDDGARLQGGATLSITRSLSGGYVYANNFVYIPNGTGFQVTNFEAQYGYSNNYDHNPNLPTAGDKIKEAFSAGHAGVTLSVGGEYVQKTGEDWGKVEKSGVEVYDWKLGVALLDMGTNKFRYGAQSGAASGVKGNVTDKTLDSAFKNINTLADFNKALEPLVANFTHIGGLFNVGTPARLLVNFDKKLEGDFAVNAEFTLNFTGINSINASVQELNLLTVTPRWEKSTFGGYLPLEITNQGHFWVGAAVKAGPVLFGLHNLGWIFSKKALPNGGGYLAVIIHPWPRENDGVPCPKF